ncbi:MAG: tRNA lysidine(34) synthetase TilS [Flavobacteriales bacterium]|nr:tRNA lysidine(34) synthetase TilS [Flavobacteriales bacterium]|tara:strand:+ start:16606 stop:17889 length:1284 start_codon:yes stop_codon:yes gene_type:complete
MLKKIEQFIREESLIDSNDKILVAVSGGRDSIVLLLLLHRLKFYVEVAHCNYQLRAHASEEDESFVKKLCDELKIPFHVKRFQTSVSAKEEGVSIQMKARALRYSWFNELLKTNKLSKIATAHHLDDQLETILINLTRGTGLKGLRGMKVKRDNIIRPLLCVTRDEINDFIYANQIAFREDNSNASTKYLRNKIRHHVVPVLKELNPSVFHAVHNTTKRIKAIEDNWELQYAEWVKNRTFIGYEDIYPSTRSFVQQFLRSKGFTYSDIEDALSSRKKGRIFRGTDNLILVASDKGFELCSDIESDERVYFFNEELPIDLNLEVMTAPVEIESSPDKVYINADKIKGKLRVRKWKKGDWFIPFGMQGKQKLSDYFINNKFNIKQKKDAWLLCDEEKVVWIIGHRLDNRCRIESGTKNIFVLEYVHQPE